MNPFLKLRCIVIAFLIMLSIILATTNTSYSGGKDKEKSKISKSSKNKTYIVRLSDSKVCLYESNVAIKEYDINPSLLAGEDILLLSNGIIVKSISEADSIAEDFDG